MRQFSFPPFERGGGDKFFFCLAKICLKTPAHVLNMHVCRMSYEGEYTVAKKIKPKAMYFADVLPPPFLKQKMDDIWQLKDRSFMLNFVIFLQIWMVFFVL